MIRRREILYYDTSNKRGDIAERLPPLGIQNKTYLHKTDPTLIDLVSTASSFIDPKTPQPKIIDPKTVDLRATYLKTADRTMSGTIKI